METIDQFLSSNGINKSDIVLDGTFKELKTNNFKGWYIGDDLGDGKRSITIEDWRTRDRKSFVEGVDLTNPDERAKLEEVRLRYEKEKHDLQLLKQNFAQRHFEKYKAEAETWDKPSQYLINKKITASYGALLVESKAEVTDIIIPMYDKAGVLWNFQKIQDGGAKSFIPGALVDGLWFELLPTLKNPEEQDSSVIMICEGYATACSVQMAIPHVRVTCAFSANNLTLAAENIRSLNPTAKIIICADDDWKKSQNTGLVKSEEAASLAFCGVVAPRFAKVRGKDWTDFNDLHQHYSLDVVKEQIENAITHTLPPSKEWSELFMQAKTQNEIGTKTSQKNHDQLLKTADTLETVTPYVNGVVPIKTRISKNGTPMLPEEFVAATELYKYYENRVLFSDGSTFIYETTHWKEVDEFQQKKINLQIQVLYGGRASASKLDATYKQFQMLLPKAGRSLFSPNPYISNFKNGTLHIERKGEKWGFRFAAHRKEDLCTHVIPIDYDETRTVRNTEFEAMMNRICGIDNDGLEKLRAVRQMYGACVAPIFPHLFMLHGPAKSGKTSLIIGAQRLVDQANWCSVEPHEFKGFTMESMAGKLVNIVTDINIQEPIEDNHIKKIEDRIPIRIDRKFQTAVMAPLPAVHIFGGNDIPPTYEKGSGAHERRWTFIHIEGLKVEGNYSKSFASDVFEACPQGVLNFALDGLLEVLEANGHYFVPESGKQKMESWETASDPVALFVKEIVDGDIKRLRFGENLRAKRSAVWPVFVDWYKEAYNKPPRIAKSKFFEAFLKVPGAPPVRLLLSEGVRYFVGLCVTEELDQARNTGTMN